MKVQAIIPSAGSGERMDSSTPKPFIELLGKPIFIHTLEVFEKCSMIDSVILVIPQELAEKYKKTVDQYKLTKVIEYISGGKTRCESVCNGLNYIALDTDVVVVHDAARPMVTEDLIKRTVDMCKNENAVVAAVPIKPTIKKVNKQDLHVEKTLPRDDLWEIQTPQVFKREVLMEAYEQAEDYTATDDSTLVEQLGIKVKVMMGDYKNIKITTSEDLSIAEVFLKLRK